MTDKKFNELLERLAIANSNYKSLLSAGGRMNADDVEKVLMNTQKQKGSENNFFIMENVIEGNKLIAEFMGYKIGFINDGFNDNNPIVKEVMMSVDKWAKYHSSWDWLMPVVEKIYSMYEWDKFYYSPAVCHFYLPENIKILTGKVNDDNIDEGYCGKMKYIYKPCEPKNAVWEAVVLFIQWYNKEQKAQVINDNQNKNL